MAQGHLGPVAPLRCAVHVAKAHRWLALEQRLWGSDGSDQRQLDVGKRQDHVETVEIHVENCWNILHDKRRHDTTTAEQPASVDSAEHLSKSNTKPNWWNRVNFRCTRIRIVSFKKEYLRPNSFSCPEWHCYCLLKFFWDNNFDASQAQLYKMATSIWYAN